MRDCMKLLISSFLDNILLQDACVFQTFMVNGVEWCHYSKCWLSPKGDNVLLSLITMHLVTYNLPLI